MKTYLLQRPSHVKNFSDTAEIQGQFEYINEKNDSDGKEMSENINDRSETEFALVQDPLNMHRTASDETILISDIPNIINKKMLLLHQGRARISIFSY